MGGLAQLCRESGWEVTGSDQRVYPPMSDQLRQAGITLTEGYDPAVLDDAPDLVVIGNAMTRGNPVVEAVLNRKLPFISGPELLGQLTRDRVVLAVAGTHGKTTTSSLLAWILEANGFAPGFLIGGVPNNFGVSARLGSGELFVVEADEYDTAFFDKRSKFVHYHPDIFGINNLEFDHADIFADLAAIETQFHHAVRRVPSDGYVVARNAVDAIDRVIDRGLWSSLIRVGKQTAVCFRAENEDIVDTHTGQRVAWSMRGQHNAENAELAVATAHLAGVPVDQALESLGAFEGVARRLNVLFENPSLRVWDDFAHHPTAIRFTLEAIHAEAGGRPLTAVIELGSNTMKQGVHGASLREAAQQADRVIWVVPKETSWDPGVLLRPDGSTALCFDAGELVTELACQSEGELVFMSNGGFSGLQAAVLSQLQRC
jgi:UDP-N-acetylmuramate: L-alanyl-gamma-D-glutamyl-meso-diaminopimelate ligase